MKSVKTEVSIEWVFLKPDCSSDKSVLASIFIHLFINDFSQDLRLHTQNRYRSVLLSFFVDRGHSNIGHTQQTSEGHYCYYKLVTNYIRTANTFVFVK